MKFAFPRSRARALKHWQTQLSQDDTQPSLLMILANAWLAHEGLCTPEPLLASTQR